MVDLSVDLSVLGIKGRNFIDNENRTVILRGINLAGISVPFQPDGATHIKENWPPMDLKNVSWVNRPFPLEESDTHFKRLSYYGFNCIRMLASWEAIEHESPYIYDEEFIEYFTELVRKAGDWGFYVFINFHQDVWSRVTGGDGHPLWLFDKVGLDYTKFDEADAAINMQYLYDLDSSKNLYKEQNWSSNSRLFPTRTMWTLFWAGNDFAPNLRLQDEITGELLNIQDYMQKHYIAAIEKIAEKVKDMPHVVGFDPINEPSMGFIGLSVSKRILSIKKPDLKKPDLKNKNAREDEGISEDEGIGDNDEDQLAEPGIAWSPLDTMAAASGFSREIEETGISILKGLKIIGSKIVNPKKINIWKEGREDFWQSHGVWNIINGEPVVLNDNYFKFRSEGSDQQKVDFTSDYLVPFFEKIADMVKAYNKNWLIFIENDPVLNGAVSFHPWPENIPNNCVDGFHWYDLAQLGLKRFLWPINFDITKMKFVFGMKGIQKMYTNQMKAHFNNLDIKERKKGKFIPLLMGEFGISMDMSGKKAYKQWIKEKNEFNWKKKGNKAFRKHEKILSLMYNSLDTLFLSSTLWNYMPFNDNIFGDQWNLEDLSIYSKDQEVESFKENKYSGARGLSGFCRPYALKIGGDPIGMQFKKNGEFILEYKPNPEIKDVKFDTEIFAPYVQYPKGYTMRCVGGSAFRDLSKERVYIRAQGTQPVFFIIIRC